MGTGIDFIKVEGIYFTHRNRKIHLRGFGIGTWLNMEHFMLGIPTPDEMIQQAVAEICGENKKEDFFKRFRRSFVAEKDFALLKECGVNFVRVPFNHRLFIDDNDIDHYKEEGFACLDRLFELGRKYQIFVMPDLHTTPGGQNPDWHSDNSFGVPLFWKYQSFRRQMTELWRTIAERYRDEPYLMGYDLLNEPAMADWSAINEYYEETIAAIRTVDQNHVIILEGDMFSMDFSGLKHFKDKQIALGFHYYPTVWQPELLERTLDRSVRKAKIADGLDKLLSISKEFGRPAFCGEFGYGIDCGEADFTGNLLKDTLDLMAERDMDWCLWCYKDAHFMSLISPKRDGRWMKLTDAVKGKWNQDIEKAQANELIKLIQKECFPEMTDKEKYLMQFRLRACLYILQKEYVLKAALIHIAEDELLTYADEFCYENCEIEEGTKEIVKRYL